MYLLNLFCRMCGKRSQVPAEIKLVDCECGSGSEFFEIEEVEVDLDPAWLTATFKQTCLRCFGGREVSFSERVAQCVICGGTAFEQEVIS